MGHLNISPEHFEDLKKTNKASDIFYWKEQAKLREEEEKIEKRKQRDIKAKEEC